MGSDLLAIVPEAPDTSELFLAMEPQESFALHETVRSSVAPEGPASVTGMRTRGPSRCPRKWTSRPSTLPWGADMAIQT